MNYTLIYYLIYKFLFISALLFPNAFIYGQENNPSVSSPDPLIIKLDEQGNQTVRFITWHQFWVTAQEQKNDKKIDLTPSIRRMRFLMVGQLSPKIMTGMHWGLNNLSSDKLSTTGNDRPGSQFFLHEAWIEFKLLNEIYLGGGLHYWQGLNRLANSSTLTFMTLDHTTPCLGWAQLGYTNQYGRNLGMYVKGQINQLDYRLAISDPVRNGFDADLGVNSLSPQKAQYNAINLFDGREGAFTFEGYMRYQVYERESITLPYMAGTYFGEKQIFNLGAGFFFQPNGSLTLTDGDNPVDGNLQGEELIGDLYRKTTLHNIFHYSVDAFYEAPLHRGAITAYSTLMHFNFGPNWIGKNAGTGYAWYTHCGYLLPDKHFQPYLAFQLRKFDEHKNSEREIGKTLHAGVNYFIIGHHAKLTLEYMRLYQSGHPKVRDPASGRLSLQAQIYF